MKKFGLKKVYLFFTSVCIFILHMPFVFAKAKPIGGYFFDYPLRQPGDLDDSTSIKADSIGNLNLSLYDSLRLNSLGLGRQVFDYAMKGFNFMKEMGTLGNEHIISIVDFSKPSSQKRLFIIDLKNYQVLFNTYVAHGMQSGKEFANKFSNKPESNKSSLGFYETLDTYMGGQICALLVKLKVIMIKQAKNGHRKSLNRFLFIFLVLNSCTVAFYVFKDKV